MSGGAGAPSGGRAPGHRALMPHRGKIVPRRGKLGAPLRAGIAAMALLGLAPAGALGALRELPPASSLAGVEPAVRGQLADARAAVERLLEASAAREAELAAAFGALGELYFIYDLAADAEPCLDNAATLAPGDPRWPYLLGTLRQARGDSGGAEAAFRAALVLAPADVPTLLRLGAVMLDASRSTDAKDAFARALALDPGSAAALEGLGRVAAAGEDHRAAIERFEAALALQPRATSLHYRLGLAYRALGELDRARRHLEQSGEAAVTFADPVLDASRRRLTGVGALLRVGQLAASSGAAAIAETRFREALALDPKSADAHQALATLYESQGRDQDALRYYLEAARLGLRNVPAVLRTASLLRAAKRPADAAEVLARAAEDAPDAGALQAELGAALEEAGQTDAALAAYQRAVELERVPERRALALFHRATLDAAAGRGPQAEAGLREAVALAPDLAEAHYNLGTLYARRGALGDAATHLARAVELRPDDAVAQFSLGMALLLSDRALEARQQLERALAHLPDQPPLEHLLARVLATSSAPGVRDPERAVALARRLVEARPSADHVETLAMALAASSRFTEAVTWQERAIEAVQAAGGDLPSARRRLALYQAGQTVMDPWKR